MAVLRRWWPLLLALAVVVLIWAFDRFTLHLLGWDGQTSDNYAAWSGSVPALITALGLTTIIGGAWHHLSCHVDGCRRIGKYHVAGGQYRCCRVHHPDPQVVEGLQVRHLHAAHWDHVARQERAAAAGRAHPLSGDELAGARAAATRARRPGPG
jgi:hypothetical protein